MAVTLRNAHNSYRFPACEFLVCRFLLAFLSSICNEDSASFSTLNRAMDEHMMPSGLAELEQIHVDAIDISQCSSTHCRWWKGWKWGKGRSEWNHQGLQYMLEQLHVEFKGGHLSSTISNSTTDVLASMCQATPTHAACEAWCRYLFLVYDRIESVRNSSAALATIVIISADDSLLPEVHGKSIHIRLSPHP